MPDTPPPWSASEAARRCGVGRATIDRYLKAGRITGATRDDVTGAWVIPLDGLLAAGLVPDRDRTRPSGTARDRDDDEDRALLERVHQLELELATARAERRAAEAIAEERAAVAADLRRQLVALEAGRGSSAAPIPMPAPDAPAAAPHPAAPAAAPAAPAAPAPRRPRTAIGRLVESLGL